MVNYQESKIYKIVNSITDNIYIGSTTQALARRMDGHRTDAKTRNSPFYNAVNEIGIEHFKILLIKSFPCSNKAELEAEEYKIMNELKKEGVILYNDYINGHSKIAKAKISQKVSKSQTGKSQENCNSFSYGCVVYSTKTNAFCFRWMENEKQKTKSFSCNKYGIHRALALAIEARKNMYPDWRTPEEEAILELADIDYN